MKRRPAGAPGASIPTPDELRVMRLNELLTQGDFAAMLCMNVNQYSRCEQGRTTMHPGIWKLAKILIAHRNRTQK